MRKYIYIAIFFLLCAGRASAQFTLVSGTVTDTSGLAYSCGTISASIVNTNGQSLYLNGVQFSPQPGATKLGCPTDPSSSRTPGAYSLQLADNTQIKCGSGASIVTCGTQTQWLFTVNTSGIAPPLGTGPQTCTAQLTVSGTTQTVNLPSCPVLSNIGATTFGVLTGQFNVKDFGAIGDAKLTRSASYTQGTSTITDSTNNPFSATDNKKFITCSFTGNPAAFPIFTSNGIAQITSVTSSSTVSIAPNVFINGIGTVSGQTCVWYTQDDVGAFCCGAGSAFAAAHTVVSGTVINTGPTIITNVPKASITCSGGFAVGGYILNQQELTTNTLGVSLTGTGCFIYFLPSAPAGLILSLNTAQFNITGLDISGLAFQSQSSTTPLIRFSNPASFWFHDNRVASWSNTLGSCPASNALVQVDNQNGPSLISKNIITAEGQGTNAGCGFLCINCNSFPTIDNNYIGNNNVNMVFQNGAGRSTTGGALVVRNHLGDECATAFGTSCIQLQNQTVMFEGGVLFGPGGSLSLDATSEADLYGVNAGGFTSAGNFSAITGASGSKLVATNSTIRGNGTGVSIAGPGAGSMTFQDLGGNVMQNCVSTTCTAATTAQTFSGNVNTSFPLTPTATTNLGASQTVSGNAPTGCTVTGNGTSTCAFDTGSTNAAWTITITAAGATTAVGNVSFTFNPALPSANSSVCTANYTNQGATGTWAIGAISPIFTVNTVTSAAFNINNAGTNLTAASTYKIAGSCYGK